MAILVINAGSSSVKFTLFSPDAQTPLAGGIVERIGSDGTRLVYRNHRGHRAKTPVGVANADAAVGEIVFALTHPAHGVLKDIREVKAVGHRVVHGGEKLTQPVVVDAEVKAYLNECARFAPLHNPHHLKGIEASTRHIPDAVQIAVFDTAFHATIPPHAFLYGLPYRFYREDQIRRYGFHGISHKYVAGEAARLLGLPLAGLRLITCHLGNGCSMAAVQGGRSIDTSMGFTPLEGLIMGTRCGDIDPAAVLHIMEHRQLGIEAMNDLLNKQSGMLGLAGAGSNDLRDILAARDAGNPQAAVALEAFCYRIKKYIGSYAAAMGGLDALVFTAGIGENSPDVRWMACGGLGAAAGFGIVLDPDRNAAAGRLSREIQATGSRVKVLVIPTNEEVEIAREVLRIINGKKPF
jgi:acetate kinase